MMQEKKHVHLNLARIKKDGEMFEVDVDPDLAIKYKKNPASIDIREVLRVENIFKDAQKGLVASSKRMEEFFGTDETLEVAAYIIKNGEIQVSADYRDQLRETKRRRIISIIHQNGIDPRTKAPHPVQRIEAAIEEAKVRIDENKSAEDQVQHIVDQLRRVLPISFSKKQILMHIPALFVTKSQGIVRSMSTIIKESHNSDGSWDVTVEIPGGMQEEFFDKLNNLTKGMIETRILKE
ncbi:MAG TPA: ribosome assembly factor SBDS [Candidatus Nanoarchaeia archaeon]|nr:ribosome assembly factor SBDS [Candidatus Nanoarchaeia archaeon]